jgi:hypothetical protein
MKQIYFILFLSVFIISCKKNKTSWDSDYALPLINDSLTLNNYVNDSTLGVNSAGFYQMNLKRELFRFDLNSEIGIPDTTIVTSFTSIVTVPVPPGTSFINDAQEKNLNLTNLELTNIILKKGQIDVKVSNPYATDVICTITLPNATKNGVVITDQLTISPGTISNPTIGTKTIDISYAILDLKGLAGNSFNKLAYQITVKSDPSGPSVNNTPSHVTKVETKIKNLELMYAKGYFGNRIITETVETNVDVLQKWISGSLDLQGINLNLALTNSIKAMARIKIIELTTIKSDGSSVSLNSSQINVAQNVNPATGSWSTLSPSVLNFPFNTSNSNIESFLENAGPKIKIVYEFELNPLGNISSSNNEIFPQSEARLDLSLDMPLSIGLTDFNLRDTLAINLSKNQDNLDRAQSAKITVDVENGFPISANLSLSILDENNLLLLTISNPAAIESSVFGYPNSTGLNTKKSQVVWELSKEDIQKIKNGSKVVIDGLFNTPNPNGTSISPVLLQENCFLGTKIFLNLKYQNEI